MPSIHKEQKAPTWEEYDDVKRACHRWLMIRSPHYRKEQQSLPERMKLKDWDKVDGLDLNNL
jgi:hypothetical protein